MSEQTVSKSVHSIPQDVIEEIESFFRNPPDIPELEHIIIEKVDRVEFIRTYQAGGGTWEEFKINGAILIRVSNENFWTWITVEENEKQKKAFGKRVKYVMQEANVPWDLAKIAVSRNPVDSWHSESTANADALKFIEEVKGVLDKYRIFGKKRMSLDGYLNLYFLAYLSKKQIQVIKEYWLSLNT